MKKAYVYLTSFFILVIVFTLLYYTSFLNHQNLVREKQMESKLAQSQSVKQRPNPVVNANVSSNETISENCQYWLQTYDIDREILLTNRAILPEEFSGLTKKELVKQVSMLSDKFGSLEKERGFLSMEVISFQKNKVVVRKNYDSEAISYEYYMTFQDGTVVIYNKDKVTIFDKTDITMDDLTVKEVNALLDGIYCKDLKEVYGILESYSS